MTSDIQTPFIFSYTTTLQTHLKIELYHDRDIHTPFTFSYTTTLQTHLKMSSDICPSI